MEETYNQKRRKRKIFIIVAISVIGALGLALAIPFTILGIRTGIMKNDYSYLKDDSTYSTKVEVEGLSLVKQKVSCGYASIEMMSSYYGGSVTEAQLDKENESISTATTSGFLSQIKKSIPSKTFVKYEYLKYDEMLKQIHGSLGNNNPVVIEWAAKYENEWTLHFSVVGGLDIKNDNVTVYNPYDYIENITVNEFLSRTSFEAYENMPAFLNFGFAYNAFDKNTIFFAK